MKFSQLGSAAGTGVSQIGAVSEWSAFAFEDKARADDRRMFGSSVRWMDIADREDDVLVHRVQRTDDEGRFTRGARRKSHHRRHALERDQVVDGQFDPRLRAGFDWKWRFFARR